MHIIYQILYTIYYMTHSIYHILYDRFHIPYTIHHILYAIFLCLCGLWRSSEALGSGGAAWLAAAARCVAVAKSERSEVELTASWRTHGRGLGLPFKGLHRVPFGLVSGGLEAI